MEIRYFQIIVPLFALILIITQIREFHKTKSNVYETILIFIFWIGIAIFAIFPDFFSEGIAKIFGIKDNINAIIFLALGLLFYFQFKLYKIFKRQDEYLTKLTREIALKDIEEE
ncbi:MAG: hypothetical protein ACI95T_001313 [Flavobacteriales bacterium]|jgi:hypothetical protein